MSLSEARGAYIIAPTAFDSEGRIDDASNDRIMDFFAECGATGITILGQAGEASKLTPDEARSFTTRTALRVRLPVVVGIAGMGLAAMRELSREAMDAGAAGVMIAPPSNLRTDDQVVAYFEQAVEAIGADVPFVIQDYPLVFGVVMSPGVIRRIVASLPSCAMLKQEDWPGLEKISLLRSYESDGSMRRISILCGSGGIFLDLEMARGADGAMTGYCFPDMLVEFVRLALAGERDSAFDLYDAHLPLIRYEHQPGVGLAARKYVLMRRGLIASDLQRKPRGTLTAAARAEIEFLLARIARKDQRASFAIKS